MSSKLIFLVLICIFILCSEGISQNTADKDIENNRLELVIEYADRILEQGRDRWSGENTPLFADGIDVETGEPVKWLYNGEEFLISNMASQQNLFRMLTGLSNLTGDDKYKEAAKESIAYHFNNLLSPSGLIQWGGHQFIDLATLEPANSGNGFDSFSHEFKDHFPFYELMWEVDEQATNHFIRALWNAHIQNWELLDMSRHGPWNRPMGDLWNNTFTDPDPFFEERGLTFVNAGGDLIYAASLLHEHQGEEGAFEWANNLHNMYVKARHPDTGLGVYQYSKPERREQPPAEGSLENYTNSRYGDRAENQFGAGYGDVAREGWVLWGGRVRTIYVRFGYMLMGLADAIDFGSELFLQETVDGLKALSEHAYRPDHNHFVPMWADGTDLTGQVYPRTGYYGQQGTSWSPLTADMEFLKTYARAYRLSGDAELWQTARNIAQSLGLGEIGTEPGVGVSINMQKIGEGYNEIYALLELYKASPNSQYLERAEIAADRMIADHYHHGFFLPDESHIHANFDRIEPLAILALEADKQGIPESVPHWNGGAGYIHGNFDGLGRTYDNEAIWSVTREEVVLPSVSLNQPGQGQVVSLSPDFSWEPLSYAAQYQIQLTASNFSSVENILLDSTLTDTELLAPIELEGNESYRWRVRAITEGGDSAPWSDSWLFYTDTATSGEGIAQHPVQFQLSQNYPNPFNPTTMIRYGLPVSSHVDLRVYDMAGREVAKLVDQIQPGGYHTVEFNAGGLASGVYIYRLIGTSGNQNGNGKFLKTRKLTLVK